MKVNFKCQAFDVFQLLIAAVVAGAILLVLLQTLKLIPSIGSQTPNDKASDAVKGQVNTLGVVNTYKDVTFNPQQSLVARTIASASGSLSPDQVCVLVS